MGKTACTHAAGEVTLCVISQNLDSEERPPIQTNKIATSPRLSIPMRDLSDIYSLRISQRKTEVGECDGERLVFSLCHRKHF